MAPSKIGTFAWKKARPNPELVNALTALAGFSLRRGKLLH